MRLSSHRLQTIRAAELVVHVPGAGVAEAAVEPGGRALHVRRGGAEAAREIVADAAHREARDLWVRGQHGTHVRRDERVVAADR